MKDRPELQLFSRWWKDWKYTSITRHEVNTIIRFYPTGMSCQAGHFRRERTRTVIDLMKAGF